MAGGPADSSDRGIDLYGATQGASTPGGDASAAELDIGQRLGRYRLVGRIGGGAMGVVWRARDPKLDRDVAIKVVHPTLARIPDAAARLLREARALAKVQHSGVVAVHDAGQDGEHLYLAMELIEGTTLGAILRERTPRDVHAWRSALARIVDAGRGLEAAHAAGVLHRDFKPDNVLVSAAGRVCVADFGLAEIVAGAATMPRRPSAIDAGDSWQAAMIDSLTTTGAVVGTPLYMSPEQLRGGMVDARSDQFGFCVTAFETLFGRRPFEVKPGPDQLPAQALLAEIVAGRIVAPPRDSKVPRHLREVVVRGLAAAPDQRWPDMRALLAALVVPPRRRARWIVAGAVAAAAIAIAIVVAVRTRAAAAPTAIQLVDLPMWSHVVSSTDGRLVVYADDDRLYVRDLTAPTATARGLPMGGAIDHVELEASDRVVAAIKIADGIQLRRWYLASGAVEDADALPGWQQWFGELPAGHLLGTWTEAGLQLAAVAGDRVEPLATVAHSIQEVAIAPGKRRLAWIDDDGFHGRLVIRDLDRVGTLASPPIDELTGMTWTADDRVVYATGTGERPTLWAVTIGDGVIGAPTRIWSRELGWYGGLAVAGGRIRLVDTATRFVVRWIDRGDQAASREIDAAIAAGAIGWDHAGRPLAWQRGSGRIVTLAVGAGGVTAARGAAGLDGDLGNATRSGDIVIASVRRVGGRELIAVSLADGSRRWSRPAGDAVLVRCAGDDHPPCVVVGKAADGRATLAPIEPDTGAVGAALPAPARIEDVAIAPDGGELILCDGSPTLVRLGLADPAPALAPYLTTALSTCRALAYDPIGGLLVSGGRKAQLYQLLHVEPGAREVVVAQSASELLSIPRASPDGRYILVLTRRFLPALVELHGVR